MESDGEIMGKASFKWLTENYRDISKLLNDEKDGFTTLGELIYAALTLGLQVLNNAYETHKWRMEQGDFEGDDE